MTRKRSNSFKMPVPPKRSIVASGTLRSTQNPYYYQLFLWKSRAAMLKSLGQPKDVMALTLAVWCGPTDEFPQPSADECLGQLHFACGAWNIEVVSHEVTHAIIHRARHLPPTLAHVMNHDQQLEEVLAYEAGEWNQALWLWLGKHDPEHDPAAMTLEMRRTPAQIICAAK